MLMNKLVPCAWLSSGALEAWRLRLNEAVHLEDSLLIKTAMASLTGFDALKRSYNPPLRGVHYANFSQNHSPDFFPILLLGYNVEIF